MKSFSSNRLCCNQWQ